MDAKDEILGQSWTAIDFLKAVEHEVNRTGYRINLEIQDRLTHQLHNPRRTAAAAHRNGFSEETVKRLEDVGRQKKNWAERRRQENEPTAHRLEEAAWLHIIENGLQSAIERRDQEAVERILEPVRAREALRERAMEQIQHTSQQDLDSIQQALDTASKWTQAELQDGAADFHFPRAELGFEPSNDPRTEWLSQESQAGERAEITGDCVTRALDQATGGKGYRNIWNEITSAVQARRPQEDADTGMQPWVYQPVYERHGLHPVMDVYENINDVMRRHLDIREIPTLLGHLFPDPDKPLTFIACSDRHAVPVVNNTVHDTWDSRSMAEQDGGLTSLHLKCDEQETLDAARAIIKTYRKVRQFDDPLTYGRVKREAVAS